MRNYYYGQFYLGGRPAKEYRWLNIRSHSYKLYMIFECCVREHGI